MRAQFWPGCEFWYQVSLLGILLLPYAYYRFILAFGGVRNGSVGRIYLVTMLICFWVNVQFGVFLEAPKMIEKRGVQTFVYEITPSIIVFFIPAGLFLIHLFVILVRICKENPTMKVQYEPVMMGVLALFLGNAFLGIPFFSGFPIDILSGVVNVFYCFMH